MKIKLVILLISLTAAALAMGEGNGKATYYKKCVSCHGVDAQKRALNISKPLNTFSKEEITKALVGYQEGNYGGKMKKLKQGLANSLSEEDIEDISAYIQTLKPQ